MVKGRDCGAWEVLQLKKMHIVIVLLYLIHSQPSVKCQQLKMDFLSGQVDVLVLIMFFLCFYLNKIILQTTQMRHKDTRIRMMDEIFNGIKVRDCIMYRSRPLEIVLISCSREIV